MFHIEEKQKVVRAAMSVVLSEKAYVVLEVLEKVKTKTPREIIKEILEFALADIAKTDPAVVTLLAQQEPDKVFPPEKQKKNKGKGGRPPKQKEDAQASVAAQ